jgi:hypothetical protein
MSSKFTYIQRIDSLLVVIGHKKYIELKREINKLVLYGSLPTKSTVVYKASVRNLFINRLNSIVQYTTFTAGILSLTKATVEKHLIEKVDLDILNNIPTVKEVIDDLITDFLNKKWFSQEVNKVTEHLNDLLLLIDYLFFVCMYTHNPYHLKQHLGLSHVQFNLFKSAFCTDTTFSKNVLIYYNNTENLKNTIYFNSIINTLTNRTLSIIGLPIIHWESDTQKILLIKAHHRGSSYYFLLLKTNSFNTVAYSIVNVSDYLERKSAGVIYNIDYKGYKHNKLDILFSFNYGVDKKSNSSEKVLDIVVDNNRIYLN